MEHTGPARTDTAQTEKARTEKARLAPVVEAFIEQVGLSTEADGLPRIAGRLFGYLLLSPVPRSLDEIAAALGVSKGSASMDARLLLTHGWLRRVSRPGDRRDYYEMAPDFFAGIVAYRLARWDRLHDLAAEARPQLPSQPAVVDARLDYLDAAQRFFADRIRALLAEWRARREAGSPLAAVTAAVPATTPATAPASRDDGPR